jgi:hypothetical protein
MSDEYDCPLGQQQHRGLYERDAFLRERAERERKAPWRREPSTANQRWLLESATGIVFDETLQKGRAALMIEAVIWDLGLSYGIVGGPHDGGRISFRGVPPACTPICSPDEAEPHRSHYHLGPDGCYQHVESERVEREEEPAEGPADELLARRTRKA